MKLKKVERQEKNPFQGYIVVNITPDDIEPADQDFLNFISELGGLSFLNTFTINEFNKDLRDRFSSRE